MSEEKKIIEECSNENITPHAIIEENKQKLKETKTKTKKNKEVKEMTLVLPEIVEVKEEDLRGCAATGTHFFLTLTLHLL